MGANDAWAVGGLTFHQGWLVVHWDGSLWEVAATGPCPWFLNDAWGTAENDVWAVGDEGAILHWDGTRWSPVASGVSANLQKVCGVAPDDIWATGDGGAAIHWDGERWSDESGGIGFELLDLWGSGPADVWATARDPDGTGSVMVHWDGAEWTAAGPPDPYVSLICGLAPDDVWALGSRLSHWDGAGWREEPPCPAVSHPHSLWCAPGGDLWVTGSWATASDAVARWRP
ncbi:MAG: hypothetical protein JXB32_21770 [Deltaproteobacteria bacterium]|nr:hypothetical protein [Deltaproteobacteria bacterium]